MLIFKHIVHGPESGFFGEQTITVPEGAKLLSAIEQENRITIYSLVEDPNARLSYRTVFIGGTGKSINHSRFSKFLGTVKVGPFVWHVFCESGS